MIAINFIYFFIFKKTQKQHHHQQEVDWFSKSEEQARDSMLAALKLGSMYELEILAGERIERFATERRELTGAYLVVQGVVQIRVGMKIFLQGPGYTIGLHQLLTPNDIVGRRFNDAWTESKCKLLYMPYQLMSKYMEQYPLYRDNIWLTGGRVSSEIILRKEVRWSPPLVSSRQVVNIVKDGKIERVLPLNEFGPEDTRKLKILQFCSTILMKGKCWEYEVEDDQGDVERVNEIKAPDLIPKTFKFATFSDHAVIFVIPEPSKPGDAARRRWGGLSAKIRSINLWVGLRGDYYRKNAMATLFGRTPIHKPKHPTILSDTSSLPGSTSSYRVASPLATSSVVDGGFGVAPATLMSHSVKDAPRLQATVASLVAENKALQQAVKSASTYNPSIPVATVIDNGIGLGGGSGLTDNQNTNPLLSGMSEFQVSDPFSPSVGSPGFAAPASPLGSVNNRQMYSGASPTLLRASSASQLSNGNPMMMNASPTMGSQSPLFGLSSAYGSSINGLNRNSVNGGVNGAVNGTVNGNKGESGLVSKMQELATLHNNGVLTSEEFTLAKMKMLGLDPPSSPQRTRIQNGHHSVASPLLSSSPRLLDSTNPQLISQLKKKYLESHSSLSDSGSNETLTQCLL